MLGGVSPGDPSFMRPHHLYGIAGATFASLNATRSSAGVQWKEVDPNQVSIFVDNYFGYGVHQFQFLMRGVSRGRGDSVR